MTERKFARFTYEPLTQRTALIRQYTFEYTTEEELEALVKAHLLCKTCQDGIGQVVEADDYSFDSVWDSPCICEWYQEDISKEQLYVT